MSKPHVMLVGAGASRAAFPDGEGTGRKLPVMNDLVEILDLKPILDEARIMHEGRNFEDIFSKLISSSPQAPAVELVQSKICSYFSSLELPPEPTLYDYLVLSMTPNDVIATFNWDPFLVQAAMRNRHVSSPPNLLFLHGNVAQGYCAHDSLHGVLGAICSRCGERLQTVPLLYPTGEKDYETEPAIASAWKRVRWAFENAFWVTIFGYSAPKTDRAAVELLKAAWGGWQKRSLEQFEFIDIRDEDSLVESWAGFVNPGQHHYDFHSDFFNSWLARHPRRSHQAYWDQYMEAEFLDDNLPPRAHTLPELWSWYQQLVAEESK